MGLVGVLVRESVTTRLWPSHPLVERRSMAMLGQGIGDFWDMNTYGTFARPRLHF